MRRRRLHSDERSLWQEFTRSIAPLRQRRKQAALDGDEDESSQPAAAKPKPKSHAAPAHRTASVPPRPAQREEPAPLSRKAKRRIARGTDAIHARIDLHGLTQAQAHSALHQFLRRSCGEGARVVLVITGKGRASGEGGVLKRQVPMWLRLPEFRDHVIGFETAGIGHGGEGALYVRLRRTRE